MLEIQMMEKNLGIWDLRFGFWDFLGYAYPGGTMVVAESGAAGRF